MLYCP